MAEVSLSGPIVDQDFTSDEFQAAHADESGIVNDWDGSAFKLTRPASGTVAEIGSNTLTSVAHVGGYGIRIPEGTTQSIDIPVSTNASVGRWDIVVARYSSAWLSGLPRGPVRIHLIQGVEGSGEYPSWTQHAYGATEDVPLHAIHRVQGVSLLDSEWRDMRVRISPNYLVPSTGLLPSPSLGATATRDGWEWRGELVSGTPTWVERRRPVVRLDGTAASMAVTDFWEREPGSMLIRDGKWRSVEMIAHRKSPSFTATSNGDMPGGGKVPIMRLHAEDRPHRQIPAAAQIRANSTGSDFHAGCHIDTDGWVYLTSTAPGVPIGPDGTFSDTFRCQASYYIP